MGDDRRLTGIKRFLLGLIALFLFVLAIQVLKEGARALAPAARGVVDLNSPVRSLGIGWLSAILVLSGSPIAASALALFDAGAMGMLAAFTMINGSRFGASFAVLLLGFFYHLLGHERHTSFSVGILTLLVTFTVYSTGMAIGILLLVYDVLGSIQFSIPSAATQLINLVYGPILETLSQRLGGVSFFLLGVGVIMASFRLFDEVLLPLRLEETEFRKVHRYIYNPWVMFLLGFGVTIFTTSVSVSIGVLIPLSTRGYVKAENLVPYIMGANVSTFIDTLIVALLLGNPQAFTVVLAEMVGLTIASGLIILLFFRRYERLILRSMRLISLSRRNFLAFLAFTFIFPIFLLVV
ncbi:MAG: hypothetical protein HY555_00695 [Euryarchaeota archaeon]|nr:hypothetical protein [Euryarchaeota archaeon]